MHMLLVLLSYLGFLLVSVVLSESRHDGRSEHLSRHPRDLSRRTNRRSPGEKFGTAVYFDGHGHHMRLRFITKEGRITLPNEEFTVQFWALPEGGQSRYTPIVDFYDECEKDEATSRWTVGIRTSGWESRDARFVFSLQTEGATSPSHLQAHKRYDPNVWTNVAASYDGNIMNLYINGAKVSLGHEQKGQIYRSKINKCKQLFLGGNSYNDILYRGKLDEFRVWDRTLNHTEIVQNMYARAFELDADPRRIVTEQFISINQWRVKPSLAPMIVKSDMPQSDHHVRFEAPPCGKTVCDDPAAVLSYLNNDQLRKPKTVQYRVVNVMNDDGSDAILSNKQISQQHRKLNKVFSPYNITFDLETFEVRNSSINKRVLMFGCFPYKIGNGECDAECGHATTGNDGGDCDHVKSECDDALLGNGVCDSVCNKVYHRYDDGDCCIPGPNVHRTCVDPNNPHRGYMNVEDFKVDLQLSGSNRINLFLITAPWYRDQFRGIATYPWEKNVYTSIGGNIMHADIYGQDVKTSALVHELGHSLGLWHVHHGISEMTCDHPCVETHPSMTLGDLCSDTRPTPRNRHCRDPEPDSSWTSGDTCGMFHFQDTPFDNYMGYAGEDCSSSFSPQQVARMHCYLDLVYQPMRDMRAPAPVPLAPKVVFADENSVRLVWLKPLGSDASCDIDNALYQYADVATSSHNGVRWSPQEATGFPDAEHCKADSVFAWKPNSDGTPPSCDNRSCWLELTFNTAVVPRRINVWLADIKEGERLLVEMIDTRGLTETLGKIPAFCDMEATLLVNTNRRIKKVKIYTSDSYAAIDAVEMVSETDFPECSRRKSPKYKLSREPAFADGYVSSADPEYTDMSVKPGVKYTYRVQALLEARASVTSPPLIYTHGQPFCGDGVTQDDEECDDKNAFDGDGCSIDCKVEEGFRCKGDPTSLCYMYQDDGQCEPFERATNNRDCGMFTPEGYIDQWAYSAIANPDYQLPECPASLVAGKPEVFKKCEEYPDEEKFWRPCGEVHDVTGQFWLEVTVYKPVVAAAVLVHLASDGSTRYSPQTKFLSLQLISTNGDLVPLPTTQISCSHNPVHVPIIQDLSKPFFLTKGVRISFTSSTISIAAVRLRSTNSLNPVQVASCSKTELYNPRSGYCVSHTCANTTCDEYPVKYGVAICTGNDEGDTCEIECEKGYFVDGHDNHAVCIHGTWMTSSPLLCSPVDCHRPKVLDASVSCLDGTTFSKTCYFKCNKPARLFGNDTSLQCQETGRWTEPMSACKIVCNPLQKSRYKHGYLKNQSCLDGSQPLGQQCKIRCQQGYHVAGERNRKRYLRLTCEDDGAWEGPTCIPNQCPPLPTMFKGAYECTNEFYSRSTCSMSCPGDIPTTNSVTCSIDGQWDSELHICPSDVTHTCNDVEADSSVEFECFDLTIGGKCSVTCTDSNQMPIMQGLPEDDVENEAFQHVPKIECTVRQQWYPPPVRIECVPQCLSHSTIGDGFCEAVNNRDVCGWDGGDCCPSTVPGGEVITFPIHCPVDCRCQDPNARENRLNRRHHDVNHRRRRVDAA